MTLPNTSKVDPPRLQFTAAERRVINELRTPLAVQRWLNDLPYNREPPATRCADFAASFAPELRTVSKLHCSPRPLLEQHGYPPLILGFESIDLLDHVIFMYRTKTGWGSVARSRDPGLHGRKPLFTTPRALALSYSEGYVDHSGGSRDMRARFASARPVQLAIVRRKSLEGRAAASRLAASPDQVVGSSVSNRGTRRYREFIRKNGYKPWKYFKGRERWTELPAEFRSRG